MRFDPIINFKLKQRFSFLGACVTLGNFLSLLLLDPLLLLFFIIGMDYLSEISQWRSYCAIEDSFFKRR
jgi:hypothetical protein